jgi:molybdopterin synthase sulfur carrier subunit
MVRILFLGRLREVAGTGEIRSALPPGIGDTSALRDWLGRDDRLLFEQLSHRSIRVAVNKVLLPGNAPIADGDEIAFLPPMSGG